MSSDSSAVGQRPVHRQLQVVEPALEDARRRSRSAAGAWRGRTSTGRRRRPGRKGGAASGQRRRARTTSTRWRASSSVPAPPLHERHDGQDDADRAPRGPPPKEPDHRCPTTGGSPIGLSIVGMRRSLDVGVSSAAREKRGDATCGADQAAGAPGVFPPGARRGRAAAGRGPAGTSPGRDRRRRASRRAGWRRRCARRAAGRPRRRGRRCGTPIAAPASRQMPTRWPGCRQAMSVPTPA